MNHVVPAGMAGAKHFACCQFYTAGMAHLELAVGKLLKMYQLGDSAGIGKPPSLEFRKLVDCTGLRDLWLNRR